MNLFEHLQIKQMPLSDTRLIEIIAIERAARFDDDGHFLGGHFLDLWEDLRIWF